MDTAQWHQDILVRPTEESEVVTNKSSVEKKVRPEKEQVVNCPRCNSTNTKFCYYNNYSLSQPRYFCKTCRRYWTQGGSLRNIPVGGGSRKISKVIRSSTKKLPDLLQNPKTNYDSTEDLNLGIYSNAPNQHFDKEFPSSSSPSALELFTGMNNDPNTSDHLYNSSSTTRFSLPSLNFSLDGLGSNYGSFQGVQESCEKHLLFPFEDLNQVPPKSTNNNANDQQKNGDQLNGGDDSTGYWNGVIDGGGSW